MKIVHLSNTPLSNAPANLAQIQRDAGHDAIALLDRQSNTNKVFVGGELWHHYGLGRLVTLLEEADVIHMHNFAWEQKLFQEYPVLIPVVKKKPCLIQYHSPRHSLESFETTVQDPFFKGRRAVVAQYQVRQYPEAEHIVPNVLPIFDRKFTPVAKTTPPVSVSFAPSNINLRGWDYKGFEIVQPVFRDIERRGLAATEIITNTPYEETLIKKKWSTIGLEEVVTGSYHLSFLEYMALGCATVCCMDSQTKDAMAAVTGYDALDELPAVQTNAFDLAHSLTRLVLEPAMALDRGRKCRDWMALHWNPTTFVRRFDEIYARI